jgi:hypothetical protein
MTSSMLPEAIIGSGDELAEAMARQASVTQTNLSILGRCFIMGSDS